MSGTSPPDAAAAGDLAEMRRQYPYATAEDHMLADGRIRLRCRQCRERPVPEGYAFAALCDPCLDARLAAGSEGRP